jgi:ATP-dependent metalloprotease
MAVKRLYERYHMNPDIPSSKRVFDQYKFAIENLRSLQKAAIMASKKDTTSRKKYRFVILDEIFNIFTWIVILYLGLIFLTSLDLKMPDETMRFEIKMAEDIDVKLDDVKGIDEIKSEVQDLIKMIKNPSKYKTKGAKIHKGVLLFGDPGVGKTLLARAIAGESGVSFIYCTGSTFDEVYVGVGAKRVRQLFQTARDRAPAIIFIDEIDSLLTKSRRFAKEHSSNRSTINQILAEMDGFTASDNIIVIGATNHEGDLDPAAIRPGRFDKKIHVPKPDLDGRKEILSLYLNKIKVSENIDLDKLGKMTPGFTGADLENLVNTAISDAVHKDKEKAEMADFEEARDRILMGIERKSLHIGNRERIHTAIHEAGHALTCYYTKGSRKLYKATIVSRGGSHGATFTLPDESDMISISKEKLLAQIDLACGGLIAEELILHDKDPSYINRVGSGCGKDLNRATEFAKRAVREFGMFGEEGSSFISSNKDETSEELNAMIDEKVKQILDASHERVYSLLKDKIPEIKRLAKNLFWYDYLDEQEIKQILDKKPLEKFHLREWSREDDYILEFLPTEENIDPNPPVDPLIHSKDKKSDSKSSANPLIPEQSKA